MLGYLKSALILPLIFLLGLACSNADTAPTKEQVKAAITKQIKSELKSNQKILQITIKAQEDQAGHADYEKSGSQNRFWNVTSDIEIKNTIFKKKLPFLKKKYTSYNHSNERKFHIWKDSKKNWNAKPN